MPKYPDIHIELVGQDGNAFNILGICLRAMRKAGLSKEQQKEFQLDTTSGDYQHLLDTCMRYFDIE